MEPSTCAAAGLLPPTAALSHAQVVADVIQSTEFASKHGPTSATPNAASYCSGYANSIAYTSPPTVSAGVEQILTFTYPNYCGVTDVSGGQVWVQRSNVSCNVGWDTSSQANITLYDGSNQPTGVAGSTAVLQGSVCAVNLVDTKVARSTGNPLAYTLTLAVTFAQDYMVGTFEVYGEGENPEGTSSGMTDLGAIAISYGPDFTLSISPAIAYVPPGGTATFTLTTTGLAGYTGLVNLVPTDNQPPPWLLTLTSTLRQMQANDQQTVTFTNGIPNGYAGQISIFGSTPQNPSVGHSVSSEVASTGSPSIMIQTGLPSPPVLTAGGSTTIPVYVSPANGTVSLIVGGLPDGAFYSFSQNPPSSAPIYLTINVPAATLGSVYSVYICGNSSTCGNGTTPSSQISLAVDIPNATVSSGSPVLNNGNTVTITYNIARAAIQSGFSCTTPSGSPVACSVTPTASGAQLQITAPRRAPHGTYILHLNSEAVPIAMDVGDDGPDLGSVSPGGDIPWASGIQIALTGSDLTGCTVSSISGGYACWQADIDFNSSTGGGSSSVTVTDFSDASGQLTPDTQQATYGWRADVCAYFQPVEEGPPCLSDWVYLTVAAEPPPCSPSITGIQVDNASTNTIIAGTSGQISLSGACFTGATAAGLPPGVNLTSLTVNSDTQITIIFSSSSGAATGSHNITVTGPGGTSNGIAAVTVALTLISFSFTNSVQYARDCVGTSWFIGTPTWPAPTTDPSSGAAVRCPQIGYAGDHAVYVSGGTMAGTVVFSVTPAPTQAVAGIYVQGVSSAGNFTATGYTLAAGQTTLSVPVTDATALPASTTQFYDPLSIAWSVAQAGSSCNSFGCVSLGASANPVYVTLAQSVLPVWAETGVLPMLTYIALAVGSGGATTPQAALANTWAQFSAGGGPANVMTWDKRPMYYYSRGFFSCAYTAQSIVETSGAADASSGQCGAFAFLLESALALNGIHSNWTQISATDGSLMVINSWLLSSTPSYIASSPWEYDFVLNSCKTCGATVDWMDPPPSGGFGDLDNTMGAPGQNTETPLEKVFALHFIVQLTIASGNQYYDPSYGLTYPSAAGFESQSVDGYANQILGDDPTTGNYHFRTSEYYAPNITFTPVPGYSM